MRAFGDWNFPCALVLTGGFNACSHAFASGRIKLTLTFAADHTILEQHWHFCRYAGSGPSHDRLERAALERDFQRHTASCE